MKPRALAEAAGLVSAGVPFEFWKLLDSAAAELEAMRGETLGDIEAGVVVKGTLFLGRGSTVKSGTRIEGRVFIGEDCTIGPNAFLRGPTMIEGGCHVGTSEVKASIIMQGSNVPHFSYVGDSIIGPGCNLGAGTKIANLRHDNAAVKVRLGSRLVDSGRRKLGALLFSGVKTGINSSINCGAVLGPGSAVRPGEFVK